jgi:hypothetical protein
LRSCKTGTRRAWYAVLTLAALTGLAACTGGGSTVSSSTVGSSTAGSSTGSSSTVSSSSGSAVGGPAVASTMSTEVIAGSGIATGPSVTVRASGDFTDKGTLKPPIDNPRTFVFRFDRGDLVVLNATGPTGGPANLNRTTCAFSRTLNGTFRVLSGNSTGSYAGATGHGSYVFSLTGATPRTSQGTCDTEKATAARVLQVLLRGSLVLNGGS